MSQTIIALRHPHCPTPSPLSSTPILPKSRSQRIPHNQLLALPKAAPQVPDSLIQRRTKHIAHVAKHTLMLLDPQSLPQKTYYRCERLVGGQLEDALG